MYGFNDFRDSQLTYAINIDIDIMLDDGYKVNEILEWFESDECYENYELRSKREHKKVINLSKELIKNHI